MLADTDLNTNTPSTWFQSRERSLVYNDIVESIENSAGSLGTRVKDKVEAMAEVKNDTVADRKRKQQIEKSYYEMSGAAKTMFEGSLELLKGMWRFGCGAFSLAQVPEEVRRNQRYKSADGDNETAIRVIVIIVAIALVAIAIYVGFFQKKWLIACFLIGGMIILVMLYYLFFLSGNKNSK